MSFKVDFSKFKKVSGDKSHTVMQHEDGHQLKIAHKALSPKMRKGLEGLEPVKMAEGGDIENHPKKEKLDYEQIHLSNTKDPIEYEQIEMSKAKHPVEYERMAHGGEAKKKLDYEQINLSNAKDPIEYEQIQMSDAKNPVEYEKVDEKQKMAEGGEAESAPLSDETTNEEAPLMPPQATAQEEAPPAIAPSASPAPQASPSLSDLSQQLSQMPGGQIQQSPTQASLPPSSDPQRQPAAMAPIAAPTPLGGYEKQVTGIQEQANAQQALAEQQSHLLAAQAQAQQKLVAKYQDHFDALDKERKAFQDDVLNKQIDPNRYAGSQSTGQRIATVIGLVLGGIGGGPNLAAEFLNKQIDRDIDAQKADLGKKENLLSANMRQFGNLRDATDMTKIMQNDMVVAQLKQAEAKAASPLAKARAQQMIGQLESQTAPMAQQLAMRQMLASSQPGELHKQDPSQLVTQLVPPDKQKEVFGQIEAAQNTRHMAGSIMKNFEDATKENTVLKTGAGLVRTPASVYGLHQALQPTFKDLEGTVRQAAMDNTFKNVTPAPGDSQHTIDQKRKSLVEYLQSKSSAPMAKGYGIDLEKFESTAAKPESRLTPQQQSFANWAKQNPNDPKAQLVLKKLGLE